MVLSEVGLIFGLIGIVILSVAIGLEIYVSKKEEEVKRGLESAYGASIAGWILFVIGIFLAWYFSGSTLTKYGVKGGKFVGKHPGLLLMAA